MYHLEWNGFESLDSVNIYFDSNTFGQTCLSANGNSNLENGCKVSESSIDVSSFQKAIENYMLGFLIWQFPTYTDKVMTLYGAKGHVVMSSKGAFYVGKGHFTKNFDIPVYFGSSSVNGFNFMGAEYASINILVALLVNAVVVYIMLSATALIERTIGKGGIYFTRKFFGIILLAISVKLFTSNLLHFINMVSSTTMAEG